MSNLKFEPGSLEMKGALFRYGSKPAQVAFQSGEHKRQLILVPGLTDGPLSLPYAPLLAQTLDSNQWSLIQAQLSSCYQAHKPIKRAGNADLCQGYGVGSLDRDAKEMHELVVHLKEKRACEAFVIMGHSTGCQDAVRFVKRYGDCADMPSLKGIILQGPVQSNQRTKM